MTPATTSLRRPRSPTRSRLNRNWVGEGLSRDPILRDFPSKRLDGTSSSPRGVVRDRSVRGIAAGSDASASIGIGHPGSERRCHGPTCVAILVPRRATAFASGPGQDETRPPAIATTPRPAAPTRSGRPARLGFSRIPCTVRRHESGRGSDLTTCPAEARFGSRCGSRPRVPTGIVPPTRRCTPGNGSPTRWLYPRVQGRVRRAVESEGEGNDRNDDQEGPGPQRFDPAHA